MQRQKMPNSKMAKIFLPFDALEGFRDMLKEKVEEKNTQEKRILSIDEISDINDILISLKKGMMIKVTYYDNELKKYINKTGIFTKMNINDRYIMVVKDKIIIDDISNINILSSELELHL